jgi:hypothetical protein
MFDAAPMPPIIPNSVPSKFAAGSTVKFARILDDFPASQGWAYTIYFNGALNVFSKAGVAQADGSFLVTITPADTSSIAPGIYRFAERVVNAGTGEAYDLDGENLTVTIEANLATAPAGAFLTWAEKTIVAIEALLSGRVTADLESYQIAGRQITKIPFEQLQKIRGRLLAQIARAQYPGTLGTPTFKIEFGVEQETAFPPTWVDVTGLE